MLSGILDYVFSRIPFELNSFATNNKNNILNLCFISHPDYVLNYEVVPSVSDHDAVIVNILNCITVSDYPKNEILCYKQADWPLIRDSLVNISNTYFRNNKTTSKSVEENWSFFRDSILKTIKDFIPVKILSSQCHLPWISNQLKHLTKKKQSLQ